MVTEMGAKTFPTTMGHCVYLKKLASGVFPESWKVLTEGGGGGGGDGGGGEG